MRLTEDQVRILMYMITHKRKWHAGGWIMEHVFGQRWRDHCHFRELDAQGDAKIAAIKKMLPNLIECASAGGQSGHWAINRRYLMDFFLEFSDLKPLPPVPTDSYVECLEAAGMI